MRASGRPVAGTHQPQVPAVTVVVLNHNGLAHLDECLSTVLAQDMGQPFQVMLWDNASADGSVEHVRARFPAVEVVACSANLGFARAMNAAVHRSATKWVALLNNDVRVPRDWLRLLLQAGEQGGPEVAAVGSRMLLYGRPDTMNHAGGFVLTMGGGFDEGLLAPAQDFAGRPALYETGTACGGAMLLPRDRFLGLGGFDESFFMYFEDADYCLRAWIQGYVVLHARDAVVEHKFGGTAGGLGSPFRLYWGQRNRIVMASKTRARARLPWALFLGCAWGLWQGLRGTKDARKAALSGTWQGLRSALGSGAERRAIQARRVRPDAELISKGVMVGFWRGLREVRRLARSESHSPSGDGRT